MSLMEQLRPYIADPKEFGDWNHGLAGQPAGPMPALPVVAGTLVINLLALALPIVILQVYDRILPNQALDTLSLLLLGLVVVLGLDALCRVIRSHITGWSGARYEHQANCRAVDRLLASRIHAVERDAPGVHIDRLMAISILRDFHAGQAKLLMVDLPFVALFLGLIYVIAGWLVLIPVLLFAALGAACLAIGRLLRHALAERATLDDRRYSFVIEALSGFQSIKLLDMEAQMARRYERLQEATAASSYNVSSLGNLAQSLGWIFSNLTMIGVAGAGAALVMEGQISMGALAACTLLAGRSVQPVLRALGLWTQYQGIAIAEKRVSEIFALRPEGRAEGGEAAKIAGGLALKDLSFSYGKDEPPLLQNVDLTLEPGEIIGISGDSGAGKTTLLMLMMGALSPSEGRVEIDGRPVEDYDSQALREQIAFMPQSAVLFQGTILENLTLFRGATSVDSAIAAARLLGVDEAIRHLAGGYQTPVGDGAEMELPVGLKQGIGMARGLARNPRIILFDEANAGLDGAADARLRDALAALRGQASLVIVSHRPSLLALADRRFDLRDGGLYPRAESPLPQQSRAAGSDKAHAQVQGNRA